ncbi:hypothetical protein TNCT_207611 [Trichonephila clavata]|uniref:Uncharacterized protein n=1 Tax=Trichonephila clavata TaxID=2740835 RepID=A0A8X6HQ41_TRICU|nr:hypothetical protein TNCT_207611 [Trichonephila clavata]
MEECEHDIKSLELHMEWLYLAEKLPLEDHLGKVLEGIDECFHHNTSPLRLHDHNYRGPTIVSHVPRSRPLRLLCGQYVERQRV